MKSPRGGTAGGLQADKQSPGVPLFAGAKPSKEDLELVNAAAARLALSVSSCISPIHKAAASPQDDWVPFGGPEAGPSDSPAAVPQLPRSHSDLPRHSPREYADVAHLRNSPLKESSPGGYASLRGTPGGGSPRPAAESRHASPPPRGELSRQGSSLSSSGGRAGRSPATDGGGPGLVRSRSRLGKSKSERPKHEGTPRAPRGEQAGLDQENKALRLQLTALTDRIQTLSAEKDALAAAVVAAEGQAEANRKKASAAEGELEMGVRKLARREAKALRESKAQQASGARQLEDAQAQASQCEDQRRAVEGERDAARAASEALTRQLQEHDAKYRSRLVLSPAEAQAVAVQRCWLAYYWGMAESLGVELPTAALQRQRWERVAPAVQPRRFLQEAAQAAVEAARGGRAGAPAPAPPPRDPAPHLTLEDAMEAEQGMRELAELLVERAVKVRLADAARSALLVASVNPPAPRQGLSPHAAASPSPSPSKQTPPHSLAAHLPSGGGPPELQDPLKLSLAEIHEVAVRRAYVAYTWAAAAQLPAHAALAHDRAAHWGAKLTSTPTPADAVDVEQAMTEIRQLRLESDTWASRRASKQPGDGHRQDSHRRDGSIKESWARPANGRIFWEENQPPASSPSFEAPRQHARPKGHRRTQSAADRELPRTIQTSVYQI